jgi:hypothetical protein
MRSLLFAAALAVAAPSLAEEPAKPPAPAKKAKATISFDETLVEGKGLPAALVITRSRKVSADLDTTADHLQEAAERR